MIDLVYILGNGSKHNNKELRYSLRSVAKYGRNYDRVIVVGSDPYFLSQQVDFHACSDSDNFARSHIKKVLFACNNLSYLKDNFLLMNDDFFLTKEVDLNNYPYYTSGKLSTIPKNDTSYQKSLSDTARLLDAIGYTRKNFELHLPIRYSKSGISKLLKVIALSNSMRIGFLLRSLFGNSITTETQEIKDLKIRDAESVSKIKELINGRDCFSIGDGAIDGGIFSYLKNEFPEPCKFENNE